MDRFENYNLQQGPDFKGPYAGSQPTFSGCSSARLQPITQVCPPLPCLCLAQQWPDSSPLPCVPIEILYLKNCILNIQATTAACRSGVGPISYHWPAALDSLAVSQFPSHAPIWPKSEPGHWHPLPSAWGDPVATGVHDSQDPMAASTPRAGPSPHLYICVCNQPLILQRHVHLGLWS